MAKDEYNASDMSASDVCVDGWGRPIGDGPGAQVGPSPITGDAVGPHAGKQLPETGAAEVVSVPDPADFGGPETDEHDDRPYVDRSVKELDAELHARGLDKGGNKAEKVARLEEDDANYEAEAE